MKTLGLTVGLLLLITLDYSTAMPHEPKLSGLCCFKLFSKRIPKSEILSITKTHSRCLQSAFVFDTYKGRICVSQSLDWAKIAYDQYN